MQLSAYEEAIAHLTRGLALLMTEPDTPERGQQELALQLDLATAWIGPAGYGPEVEKACTRARELCQQIGQTSQLCRILGHLSIFHYIRAEYRRARELAEEALSLAESAEEPLLVTLGHWYLGFVLFGLGECATAQAHLERVIDFYKPEEHHRSFVFLRGSDAGPSALAYSACCSWWLGYPDQALRRSHEAFAMAQRLGHPISLADALCYAGCLLHSMCRDARALKDNAEALMQLSKGEGLAGWKMCGARYWGEALAMLGHVHEGIAQMREGVAGCDSLPVLLYLPGTLGHLAQAQGKAGHPDEGLTTLAQALAAVEETGERLWEAELHRLRGELLLLQAAEAEAEASFHKAIEVARRQQAKSWELRATMSLCRLWQSQGRTSEAHRTLAEVCNWFTEGYNTPDLREARDLLEDLSGRPSGGG